MNDLLEKLIRKVPINLNGKLLGVLSFRSSSNIGSLKRELLLFDAIAIPYIYPYRHILGETTKRDYLQFDFLLEKGLVIDPVHPELLPDEVKSLKTDAVLKHLTLGSDLAPLDLKVRKMSQKLRDKKHIDAVPLYRSTESALDDFVEGKANVIDVAIKNFPQPSAESVSWEQILDFKNDPQTKNHFIGFRHWITKISRNKITYNELTDEISYLANEYKRHLELHRLKSNTGIIQSFATITAEALEGIINLKPTKVVNAVFSLRQRKIDLIETELNAPGRELAYIINAQEFFPE